MLRNPFRDIDAKNLRRSSDVLKKQNDYYKIVNKRLTILMIVIVLLFAGISVRLMDVQIRQKDAYTTKLAAASLKKQVTPTPRGQMVDRKGVAVATTVSAMNIIYNAPSNVTAEEQWELAQKFAQQFQVTSDSLTTRDLKDAYITLHKGENGRNDQANHLFSEEELSSLKDDALYKLKLERITKEMLDAELDEATRNAWVVYSAMEVHSESSHARVILENVDSDKVAYLTEHKEEYRGFDVDFSSWRREYPFESTLRDVLGQITTNKQGLPSELQLYYQAKGYEMNARVGRSGLEQQYEDLLSGTSKVSTVKYDENGNPIFTEINAGKKGYDVQLTIDVALQQKVDDILKSYLQANGRKGNRPDFSKLFFSLMNPKTGEIYAMSGMLLQEDGTMIPYASGNYIDDFTPGSVVKGATVYMGLNEGVVTPSEQIYDTPMKIQGTATKQSYNGQIGLANAVRALELSSNVYMFNVAIRLAGATYVENQPLGIDAETAAATFKLMTNYYASFGLGTLTGLDVPNEKLGFTGTNQSAGLLLDYSIGQYNNYTPIQLLQYVSTIANDGVKVQPRLVSGAYGVNSDYLVFTNEVKVQSTIYGNTDYLDTVQDGFHACVTSKNCGGKLQALSYDAAAKTGTAEVTVLTEDGTTRSSTNASMVGYAPFDNPEVAFVCAAPTSSNTDNLQSNSCYELVPQVLEAYYASK